MGKSQIVGTGGDGCIGTALVRALNQGGRDDIIVAGSLGRSEKWRNLTHLRFEDYLEYDRLVEVLDTARLDGVGVVFHMGACSDTTETDCRYLIQNNYEYTRQLAEWALNGGKRFIYASSAATNGDGSAGMKGGDEDLERLGALNTSG